MHPSIQSCNAFREIRMSLHEQLCHISHWELSYDNLHKVNSRKLNFRSLIHRQLRTMNYASSKWHRMSFPQEKKTYFPIAFVCKTRIFAGYMAARKKKCICWTIFINIVDWSVVSKWTKLFVMMRLNDRRQNAIERRLPGLLLITELFFFCFLADYQENVHKCPWVFHFVLQIYCVHGENMSSMQWKYLRGWPLYTINLHRLLCAAIKICPFNYRATKSIPFYLLIAHMDDDDEG